MSNKRNLPGFTAETSLYIRGGHYYVAKRALSMTQLRPQTAFLSQAMGGRPGEQRMPG